MASMEGMLVFVALRDLRAARGRFALITLVVLMVAVLTSFLSGLTAGLRHQNVSAIESITAHTVVFSGEDPSFDDSSVSAEQIATWARAGGEVDPIGINRAKAMSDGGSTAAVAVIGADAGVGDRAPTMPNTVVLSEPAASDLDAGVGDTVTVGGEQFAVGAVRGDDWFSHSPVVWIGFADWQALNQTTGATVLAVSGISNVDAVDRAAGTTSTSVADSIEAIGSYKSENMSLTLMTVMLFAISALVIGAFFTVWTIQRAPDIAVLKALGASTGSLVRDALGQALIVLVVGVGAGLTITVAAGQVMGDAVPFVVDTSTTIVPVVALIGLGLLGAGFALRFVSTTDPLTALGSTR